MIQPRNDRVLIQREVEPQTGLIIRPEVAADKGIKGVVLAVGPKATVKVGDKVLFNSRWNDVGENYETPSYNWDDKLHLVQEADIFGIINA